MNKLLKSFKIDEKLTRPRLEKQPVYNQFKNNIPRIEDYNFMADLIEMPETKNKNKYILLIIDLATNEFDIEPLKNKSAEDILVGSKKIFKRSYLKVPYASIRTDNGREFKGVFDKFCNDNNIFHKVNIQNRHSQLANIDSLCNQLERLFNGYMNHKEEETGKIYKNWDDITDKVRKGLNKIRKIKLDKFDINDYPFFINYNIPKFKIGQIVHYKLDTPENALGTKQPTSNFRTGDYRYSNSPRKITQILYMNDEPYFRYILEGIKNASYSEYQLIKSRYKHSRYKVKKIIDDRIVNNKREFLIWWDRYLKSESTWQKEAELRKDGIGNLIDEYLANKN
jgi:hypothetical protein